MGSSSSLGRLLAISANVLQSVRLRAHKERLKLTENESLITEQVLVDLNGRRTTLALTKINNR